MFDILTAVTEAAVSITVHLYRDALIINSLVDRPGLF